MQGQKLKKNILTIKNLNNACNKCYDRNKQRKGYNMELFVAWIAGWNTAQWVITFLLSIIALVSAIWGCAKKAHQRRVSRMKEQQLIIDELTKINTRLDNMDRERTHARDSDAYIRSRQYLGTVAVLDAIMRLAEHQGLKINGEVAKYREENIECLKNGTGIYHFDCD